MFNPFKTNGIFHKATYNKSGWSIVYWGINGNNFQKYGIFLSENHFVLANSANPDEMYLMRHFIWVFTVCHSTHLGVSSPQRVNNKLR